MKSRKVLSISYYEEDEKRLDKLCEMSGMTSSELIRTALAKIYSDPVELTILMQNFLNREAHKLGKERLLRIMSTRKRIKAETQRSALAVSLNNRLNHIANKEYIASHSLAGNPLQIYNELQNQLLPDEEDLKNQPTQDEVIEEQRKAFEKWRKGELK